VKVVDTVVGPIHVRRADCYCQECGHGLCQRDQELGGRLPVPGPALDDSPRG
jgi:hypothetical protein